MTRINDYLWHLPHDVQPDDPPDVALLQAEFNAPVAAAVERALGAVGYRLASSDVVVRLDDRLDHTANTFYANVRFIAYLEPDVLTRVHFEHFEWAHFLADRETHRFAVNLDRFKVRDPRTQVAVPAWPGRLHTRMSAAPGDALHPDGRDQVWAYTTPGELAELMLHFLDKFERVGRPWLENRSTMAG